VDLRRRVLGDHQQAAVVADHRAGDDLQGAAVALSAH
jgi:hypothetical protein